ncbi:MAG: prolyl oligopeptidase family serine peptidase [Bacteroidales bacterium]|jgi:prolyl oligopeptidase|nr:prolyl oligopeptidase family serine peptidase [Bacteroidales bacterium]MDY0334459.1 prolyl oligopeptidase family serine peptidase [Bacteroidales bacterium]
MRKLIYVLFITGVMITQSCQQKDERIKYPETRKSDVVDTLHGQAIADPYRWLENDTSAETGEWVKQQNEVTDGYLSKIPFRNDIKDRLTEIWDYPKYSVPFKKGDRYFYFKNDGMQNQSVLYVQESLDAEPQVLLDPNKLSDDGTVAFAGMDVSKDGKYLAYAIARGGSDWNEIKVMEIDSRNQLDDHLKWVKFSGMAWKDDGFYYSRYDEPTGSELSGKNEYHKVYFHKVGEPQSSDVLVFEDPNFPLRNYSADVTDDEEFLLLYQTESTSGNALYFRDLRKSKSDFIPIVEGFDNDFTVVDDYNGKFLVRTNYNAPKYQLLMIDPVSPQPKNWVTMIPEKDEVLERVTLIGGKMVAQYLKDAYSQAFIHDMWGNLIDTLDIPGIGTMSGFNGKKDEDVAFYAFTSFTIPSTIYMYNIQTDTSTIYRAPEVVIEDMIFETKQVFVTSKDGTQIPMFIVHKAGITLDGTNPTLLYGYGGFNISLTPSFSISRLILLEKGGVFAMPNLRGGGEYGEAWHMAGTKEQKQNVFDDFIAAAEYLIDAGYTSPDYLAIQGGSNGGLLVGAVMTQRPDLMKVAFPAVGVLDMLRYHMFTIGWAWATDYGTSDEAADFEYLIKYSPLHNIKAGTCYPATLVTTADHDDRVVPAHSFKFISELQANQSCANPTLIRIETKAGHGAGKPTTKVIEEYADIYSFMFYNMGITPVYP